MPLHRLLRLTNIWHVQKDVCRLASQHVADLCQRFETHAFDSPALEQRRVGLGYADALM